MALIGFSVFYGRQEKKPKPFNASDYSSLPVVFTNIKEGIQGISAPLNSEWNLYTNKGLGFKLAYPAKRFNNGVLRAGEIKDYKPIQARYAGDPFYQIVFSDGDFSPIYIVVEPSRSPDINTWLARQKEYQLSSYDIRPTVVDGRDAIIIRHIPIDQGPQEKEEENIREHLVVVRDGVLYEIDASRLNSAERETIFGSFHLL